MVLETDNPVGDLALEAATVSSDETGRLITETENTVGEISGLHARILLETSSSTNSLYLILNASDTSGSNSGNRIVSESVVDNTFNLALEPPNTLNGGDFLPGGAVPPVLSFLLELGSNIGHLIAEDSLGNVNINQEGAANGTGRIILESADLTANTGDKLELEIDTPNCGRQNSFFTFDVTRNDRVLDEDGANQYLETAGVGYRNSAGERGLVISRVVAKINLPTKNVNSIPNGSVFLGENTFENELGGISLEVGRTGGGGTSALILNGFNQFNPLGNVDRVAATGDKLQLQTAADSNVGSGVTFKDYGEYINDGIVLDGSDGSSSNAGDNITLEAGTLTDNKHRLKSMTATDVLIGETRLVKSFHKIRDIIRPPRLVARKDSGEIVNIISEHIGSSGNETTSSSAGSIKLEDDLLVNGDGNLLLEVDGPLGNKYALESNSSFLVPEDFTSNQNTGVVPPENFGVSSVLNIEPRYYSSDVAKRPLGAISFESTGVGVVHLRLEDGTVGVIAGSHRPAGDGFLVSEGELQTTEDIETGVVTTLINENIRYGMEVSLHSANGAEQGLGHGVVALNRAPMGDNNNIGERLIMESATILDYLENTSAISVPVTNEFGFDNTSVRFDQTNLTFDSTQ